MINHIDFVSLQKLVELNPLAAVQEIRQNITYASTWEEFALEDLFVSAANEKLLSIVRSFFAANNITPEFYQLVDVYLALALNTKD
ncbi:MAG: hypothetical protein KGI50_08045 [Patescibacteria group bacterium]|nr:hypothetical protein [Patescibacteria group bacterium]